MPDMPTTITLDQLRHKHACLNQTRKFQRNFGAEVTVTEELARQHTSQFDWDWAAHHLLTAPARRAYEEAKALAWRAYGEAKALALRAYGEAKALAFVRAYISEENDAHHHHS